MTAATHPNYVSREEILRLHRGPWKKSGAWMMALCPVPAHGDGQKHGGKGGESLGISDRGILSCFAGCDFRNVMTALRAGETAIR